MKDTKIDIYKSFMHERSEPTTNSPDIKLINLNYDTSGNFNSLDFDLGRRWDNLSNDDIVQVYKRDVHRLYNDIKLLGEKGYFVDLRYDCIREKNFFTILITHKDRSNRPPYSPDFRTDTDDPIGAIERFIEKENLE